MLTFHSLTNLAHSAVTSTGTWVLPGTGSFGSLSNRLNKLRGSLSSIVAALNVGYRSLIKWSNLASGFLSSSPFANAHSPRPSARASFFAKVLC